MADKLMTEQDVVSRLESGMTIGIGGWGSRRKPMSLVRALLRSDIRDLTVVSYGGPDVGLLLAAGKVSHLVYGFVSLDSIPLEPHFRAARERGGVRFTEYDEGMLQWGLRAAAHRLPFLPTRAGLASDVLRSDPALRLVKDPYGTEELLAMPALRLDAALVHLHRADASGNARYLGIDPYFDDLFCQAADKAYVSAERIVPTEELVSGPPQELLVQRWFVEGVVHAPFGAHFTSCEPDYARDEQLQSEYAQAAASPDTWEAFVERYLGGDETSYRRAAGVGVGS
ncbi:CoA transferase subunit A [Pseudonocardia ailaonensis]|uniref:CoA transferase subunit A n=1 Tax=Pseudonocardia ailaonensis TaxID=367279 RepID=A0ABN2MZM3_9PSEU